MKVQAGTPLYKTASEKILEILEDEIHSGKYNPGDRLIKREIADRLGVIRVPVREALIILERWGFIKGKKPMKSGGKSPFSPNRTYTKFTTPDFLSSARHLIG